MQQHLALALLLAAALGTAVAAPAGKPSTAGPRVGLLPQTLTIAGLERPRQIRLYLPPSYASSPERRYPVIYMHDGQNLFDDATSYAGEWGADETLDALAQSHGFEAIVVGIDNGGEKRMSELLPWPNPPRFPQAEGDAYLDFIVKQVKPLIDRDYRSRPEREHTAVMGSSMGGLISHYAIQRHPEVFSKAGVFSPSYWIAPRAEAFFGGQALPADSRVYLYAGGREREIADGSRQMREWLAGAGLRGLALNINPRAEHNEAAWRAELARSLIWLFELQPAKP